VDHPEVLRILINAAHIERVFVSPTIHKANADMDGMLENKYPTCTYATADGFNTNGSRE